MRDRDSLESQMLHYLIERAELKLRDHAAMAALSCETRRLLEALIAGLHEDYRIAMDEMIRRPFQPAASKA